CTRHPGPAHDDRPRPHHRDDLEWASGVLSTEHALNGTGSPAGSPPVSGQTAGTAIARMGGFPPPADYAPSSRHPWRPLPDELQAAFRSQLTALPSAGVSPFRPGLSDTTFGPPPRPTAWRFMFCRRPGGWGEPAGRSGASRPLTREYACGSCRP